jgi:hypothetical protein
MNTCELQCGWCALAVCECLLDVRQRLSIHYPWFGARRVHQPVVVAPGGSNTLLRWDELLESLLGRLSFTNLQAQAVGKVGEFASNKIANANS